MYQTPNTLLQFRPMPESPLGFDADPIIDGGVDLLTHQADLLGPIP